MSQQIIPFDYSGIDPEIAALMQQTAQNIHAHVRQTVENAAADGEALIKIKDYLTHGSFLGWVQNVVGLEPRVAQTMMQIAILCRSNARYFAFGLTVVQELAAPSTPDDVRRAVLAGEVAPTVKAVKEAKRQAMGRDVSIPDAPTMGARLYNLLQSDAVYVSNEEAIADVAYWFPDTGTEDDNEMRHRAFTFAKLITEGLKRATEDAEDGDD